MLNHSVTPTSRPANSFSESKLSNTTGAIVLFLDVQRDSSRLVRPWCPRLCVPFSQLPLGNRLRVHFIRPVGQSQRANHRPSAGEKCVLRNSGASMRLNRAVEH